MKKFLLSLSLVLLVFPLFAQDLKLPWERTRPKGEIAIDATASFDPFDLDLTFCNGEMPMLSAGAVVSYRFNRVFRVGIGAEFFSSSTNKYRYRYEKQVLFWTGVPVFADLRMNLGQLVDCTPVVEFRIGKVFGLKEHRYQLAEPIVPVYGSFFGFDWQGFDEKVFIEAGAGVSIKRSCITLGVDLVSFNVHYLRYSYSFAL